MIRVYCDVCGSECVSRVSTRIVKRLGRVAVEIMVATATSAESGDLVWNKGDVCEECVLEVCAATNAETLEFEWASAAAALQTAIEDAERGAL